MAFQYSVTLCRSEKKSLVATWVGEDANSPSAVTSVQETQEIDSGPSNFSMFVTFTDRAGYKSTYTRYASRSGNKIFFELDGAVAPYDYVISAVSRVGQRYSLVEGSVSLCSSDGGTDGGNASGNSTGDSTGDSTGGATGGSGTVTTTDPNLRALVARGFIIPSLPTEPESPACLPPQPTPRQKTLPDPCGGGGGQSGPQSFSGS